MEKSSSSVDMSITWIIKERPNHSDKDRKAEQFVFPILMSSLDRSSLELCVVFVEFFASPNFVGGPITFCPVLRGCFLTWNLFE